MKLYPKLMTAATRNGLMFLLVLLSMPSLHAQDAWLEELGGEWIKFTSYTTDSYHNIFTDTHRTVRALLSCVGSCFSPMSTVRQSRP